MVRLLVRQQPAVDQSCGITLPQVAVLLSVLLGVVATI